MDYLVELAENRVLWISILAFAIAQAIKITIEFSKVRKVNYSLLLSSGGMPSSHTSLVVAMSMSTGLKEGFGSVIFAVSAVISLVVMYDAAGVRRAAGKQAEIINMLVANIENSGIKLDKKLKELLGHSPVEVAAGAILGFLVAVLFS